MELTVLMFGICAEITGTRELRLDPTGITTVGDLRNVLTDRYDALSGLNSLMIAVNSEYADDLKSISSSDEIAMIPPVSGG